MLLNDQRVIFSDNGTLIDISKDVNDYSSGTRVLPYVSGQDYVYIGTFLPFNHRYFEIGQANNVAASPTIEVWNGRTFVETVDILDQTASSSVALAQSGYIRWSCDRNTVWNRESYSSDVTGLENTYIPSFFWLRLSWSASLLNTTSLKFIGHKFSSDSDLYKKYPDLNNSDLKTAFAVGKTTWEEQAYIAAEEIISDLRKNNLVVTGDQILDHELFIKPSVHKVAELIYYGLGETYKDRRATAKASYADAIDMGFLRIDQNRDAMLDEKERITRTGFLTR